MKLFFREYGQKGPKLVVLHGLYGASDNWVSIARQLEKDFHVYLVDQRNHGKSPHSPEHSYELMTSDLLVFFEEQQISKAHIMGHSMGGKTAMRFALEHHHLVDKLIVLDIAPKSYASFSNYAQITNNHLEILKSLKSINLDIVRSRSDIDKALASKLEDIKLRQFLLKNIARSTKGQFYWKLNIDSIWNHLNAIMDGFSSLQPEKTHTSIPSIFIKGEKSGYVIDEDSLIIRKFFKNTEIVNIPNAGHWLHAEQPELLLKTIAYFLLD